jgi:outer membrane receptor protein involved in Fe transport
MWTDSRLVENLVWKIPGLYAGSLGEIGKPTRIYFEGLDSRYLNISLDGRPIADPVTGEVNLADIPLEYLDAVEILPRRAELGAVATINALSKQYNSLRPMTKLRYAQNPFETVLTDALFSQNVARGVNLSLGLQRHSSRGRYKNGDLDSWNTRFRLRYNANPMANFSLLHTYNATRNGLNGGVDRSLSPELFEEARAIVQTETGRETIFRSDWTLSGIVRLFPDSLSLTQFSLYTSSVEREYTNTGDLNHVANEREEDFYSLHGMRATQTLTLHPIRLTGGIQLDRTAAERSSSLAIASESGVAFFASGEVSPLTPLNLTVHARNESRGGLNVSTAGGMLRVHTPIGNLWASVEEAGRIPTLQERFAVDSLFSSDPNLFNESRYSISAGVEIQPVEQVSLSLSTFQHRIEQAVVFQPSSTLSGTPSIRITNIAELKTRGIAGNLRWRWNSWEAVGSGSYAEYTEDDVVKTPFPDLLLAAEVSYRRILLKDALDGKVGIRAKYSDRQQSVEYSPRFRAYTYRSVVTLGRMTIVDAFLVFHLGDAMISLSWENLLNTNYMALPFYPMPGRHLQLAFNWMWVD